MVDMTAHSSRYGKDHEQSDHAVAAAPVAYSYIRFSTLEQQKGDSLRRQIALSREFARAHGLHLDESLTLKDLGVSAFRGKNKIQGALASFLKAVEERRVPRGSYLLVESLDRLSRAQITEALTTFLQIVNAGIVVVTLADKMTYSKESLDQNMGNLMVSLVIMARAHEESLTKSRRLSAAWQTKRDRVLERKLTAQAPAWLRLSADRKVFEAIPERVEIVRRIFADAEHGHGKRSIARWLNSEGTEPWGKGARRGHGWHESYIQKILNNRAVVGEFQPHRIKDGKRLPEGEPAAGYFPTIIDPAIFQRINARTLHSPGPVGTHVSNLFTGIAFDGYTGATMRFVDKGTKTRGKGRWKYLMSDFRRINPTAATCSWNYVHFEELVLRFILDLDWQRIVHEGSAYEDSAAEQEVNALAAKVATLSGAITRVVQAIETSPEAPTALVERLLQLEGEHQEAKTNFERKRSALEKREQAGAELAQQVTSLKALAVKARDTGTRLRLREELRRKIKRIDLYPNGLQREWRNAEYRVNINSKDRLFAVVFHNGVIRWVLCIGLRPEALSLHQIGEGDSMRWTVGPIADGKYRFGFRDPIPAEILRALGPRED